MIMVSAVNNVPQIYRIMVNTDSDMYPKVQNDMNREKMMIAFVRQCVCYRQYCSYTAGGARLHRLDVVWWDSEHDIVIVL